MKKLSIVVPCYNVEKYIPIFFENMEKQILSIEKYELILVDDQSTDESYQKLLMYVDQKNIDAKVIQLPQKGGAGGARNCGMLQAKGEYIMFVDMDDEFAPEFFVKMITRIEEKQADIVICDYYGITAENRKIHYSLQAYSDGSRDKFLMGPAPWNKIFKRKFIEQTKILFQEQLRHQDLGTIPKWMYLANTIDYITEPLYFYKIAQPGSITRNTSNFNEDIYLILDDLINFFDKYDPTIGETLIYNHLVTRHLYYGNHSLIDCIKYHQYLMSYVVKKYPNCMNSEILKQMDVVVKTPYYLNYYSKGILSGVLFKFIKKFNLERFLYTYE